MNETHTRKQLEMMKDLLQVVTIHGGKGISIRKGERKHYAALERDGLVYFLSGFGRGSDVSIRLTDAGVDWAYVNFAYAYKNLPQPGKTTWQDKDGNVTLIS